MSVGEERLLIGGRLQPAGSGATFENIDPATEKPVGVTADAGPADMDAAIGAARQAFDASRWSTDTAFRSRCLRQLADGLEAAKEELREVLITEAGCPLALTYGVQLEGPIQDLAYWADLADRYTFETELPDSTAFGQANRRRVWREAAGVVGAITPWNFPVFLNLAKLSPALAAGCTVVLKPAPDTPWSATVLGRVIAEATDIPAGVVNVIAASDHQLGEMLTTDPRVDLVTFTGSTATGRRVMANAAQTVKKVSLELGGKSANIFLDDADFATFIPAGASFTCLHAGQGCALTTRMLLPASRYEEGVELAKAVFAQIPYGDPRVPEHIQGPLISSRQRDRVLGYIRRGQEEGARLVTGGGVPAHLPQGYYVEPTLFADVDPRSTIAQEEIFGPVLVLIPYGDDDDAVRIANDTPYGLSGAVTSADEGRALAVARRLRTGTVGVNGGIWLAPDTPFGGYRQSGLGREGGVAGLEEYLETKVVALPGAS
jgi:aldehyde dehydrogenase (NAD+)